MPTFRKKPVIIEAIQWTGNNLQEIIAFLGDSNIQNDKNHYLEESRLPGGLIIKTLEGEHQAAIGDWIIKGVQGEHYPCKPDVFDATYEPVNQ